MAAIRIPESAERLLPLCRTSGASGSHIWETYADMIAFLAALGYSLQINPNATSSFIRSANPIDFSVFRSRGYYPQLLMLAIAHNRDWTIAKHPEEISKITEQYAAVGADNTSALDSENLIAFFRNNLLGRLESFAQI